MLDETPWVTLHDSDYGEIVGNHSGLKTLQDSIVKALETGESEVLESDQEIVVSRVLCREKEEYFHGDESNLHKETLLGKSIGFLLMFWFLIMPFVAVGLIVNSIYTEKRNVLPENCIKMSPVRPACDPFPNKFKQLRTG
jgi:hypothetical protein